MDIMIKDEIGKLKDVKLVTGNGFDLACGMKTRYSDYFYSREAIYKEIKSYIEQIYRHDKYYFSTKYNI